MINTTPEIVTLRNNWLALAEKENKAVAEGTFDEELRSAVDVAQKAYFDAKYSLLVSLKN